MPDTPIRWQRAGPAATSRYHGRRIHAPRSGKIACGISVIKPTGGRRPPHRSRCPVVAEVRTTNSWARLRGATLATARQTSVGLFTVDDGRTLKGYNMKTWTSPSTTTIAVESLLRDEPRHAPGGHQPSPLVVRSSVAPHLLTSLMAIIKRSSHKGRAKRCVGRGRFGHGHRYQLRFRAEKHPRLSRQGQPGGAISRG
jgi:hypothetical protein